MPLQVTGKFRLMGPTTKNNMKNLILGFLILTSITTKAQLASARSKKKTEPVGYFINDSFNRGSLGSNWTMSGTANWNLDGTDATTDSGTGVIDSRIRYAGASNDRGNSYEDCYMEARIQLLSTPSSTTIGIALMFADFATPDGRRDILGQLYLSTSATLGGEAIIQTYNGTTNVVVAQSAGNLVRTNGDWYYMRLTRAIVGNKNNYTMYARKESDGTNVSSTWDEPLSHPQSAFGNSTGQFAISSLGGIIKIDYFRVWVNDKKNAHAVFVGDSKTHGAYSTDMATRYVANVFPANSYAISAGSGDGVDRVVNKVQTIIEMKPKNVLIMIGGNDVRNATASGTWQANMNSVRSSIKTALPGCQIYWLQYPEETALDISPVNTYIQSKIADATYAGDIYIPITINTGTDLVGDGVHPDQSGHDEIAADIQSALGL
jgi:lysophospholipase L1-like esterase